MLDVTDQGRERHLRKIVFQRLLNLVKPELGQVEKHQPRGTEARDLAAELGADRPAGAGDHDDAPAQPFAETGAVEHHGIAAQKVVELDVPDRGQLNAAADQVVVRRHRQRLDAGGGAKLSDAPAHPVRRGRQGEDDGANAEAPCPERQLGDRTQNADVAQQPALLARIVIEQTDNAPLAAVGEFLGQPRSGLARAQNQHRLAQCRKRAV